MGLLSSIFGSSSTSKTSTSVSMSADQRVGVGGSVGTLISPEAALVLPGGGSVQAQPYSTVTQNVTSTGMQPGEVGGIMEQIMAGQEGERAAFAGFGTDLAKGLTEQSKALTEIVGATRVAEGSQLIQLVPLVLVVVLIWAWSK